jgi:hypothetical protein
VPLLGNLALGGLLVSGAAYIAAIAGLYRLVSADFDREVAQRAVLYLSLFPAAFFLFAPFTEALFLALAVWTLVAARRGAWGWAALAGFLAALTRTQGCLLALPLAWEGWRQWRAGRDRIGSVPADGKSWPPPWRQLRAGRGRFGRALAPLAPLGGLAAFTAYTKAVVGLTPFQAQDEKWLSAFNAPWTVVALSWQHVRRYGDAIQGLNLAVLLLFSVLLVVGLWRLPATYSLYAVPQLLLLETRTLSTWLASTTRLVLVIFPAFVCLALLGRRRGVHAAWLVVSLWLLAILFYAFLSDVFVA